MLSLNRTSFILIIAIVFVEICKSQNNAYPLKNSLWPTSDELGNHKISVCWDNPSPQYKEYMDLVEGAVKSTWQKYSRIEFTDWCPASEKNCDIHIFISDTIPHTINLGMMLKNKARSVVLNFELQKWNSECKNKEFCIKAVAVHEFGHVLGFAHEQNRKNCSFPNCLGRESGENGDWTLNPCDSNSVMNYCNPKYMNDGFLSPLDIKDLQKLYDVPNLNIENNDLDLVYTSTFLNPLAKDKEISHNLKIYISGNYKDFEKIDHVLYYLDPNWFRKRQRTLTTKNPNSHYGIGLNVWGPVHIVAYIFLDEGKSEFTEVVIHKYLTLD